MAQGVLPYKYEEEKTQSGMTALAGLPIYLDLASVLGLGKHIHRHMHVKNRGWTDEQTILSLILLNLAGGNSVDDLEVLEKDKGFCTLLDRIRTKGLTRKKRRDHTRRWRKTTHRVVASPSAIFRYLAAFHDPEEEKKREKGKAFIPLPNEHLKGLIKVNRDFISSVQRHRPKTEAFSRYGCHHYRHAERRCPFLLQRIPGIPTHQHLLGRTGTHPPYRVQRRECSRRI
jgi:hypothetical protein